MRQLGLMPHPEKLLKRVQFWVKNLGRVCWSGIVVVKEVVFLWVRWKSKRVRLERHRMLKNCGVRLV